MTSLDLVYVAPAPSELDLLFVEVFDRKLNLVPKSEVTLSPDLRSYALEVPAGGDYLVRVRRTMGKGFNIPVSVPDGQSVSVTLRSPQGLESAWRDSGPSIFKAPRRKRKLWARLWARTDGTKAGWSQETPEDPIFKEAEDYYKLSIPGRPGVLRYFQLGGDDVPRRLVALPPVKGRVEIVCTAARRATVLNGGLSVVVSTGNPNANVLLKAISSAGPDAAEMLIEHAATSSEPTTGLAELLLRDKFDDPGAAAVGGYFLLRFGEVARLHGWPAILDEGFEWLPDGAIIRAWQLLSRPGFPDHAGARKRLLACWQRGLPVVSEGLRLLRDGLVYFATLHDWLGHPPFTGETDKDVVDALGQIKNYLAAADWDQPQTTFYGLDPKKPEPKPITGSPKTGTVLGRFEVAV